MHSYLPYVDGLRALAVLSVLLYHLEPSWLPGGFAGVDIFFVISGFIVSVSVGERPAVGLLRFAGFFYARRMVRILPALVVCLLATTLATAVLVPPAWLSNGIARTGLAAFFGLSNFVLAQNDGNYFSPVAEFNPFTHTWSLGVEEQFYLIFPLVFFIWSFGAAYRRCSVWLFGLLLLASLGYSAWLGGVDRPGAFYQMASRFWQLAAGVLLYQLMALRARSDVGSAPDQPALRKTLGVWISLGLVLYGLVASHPQSYAFPGAVPTVLGTLGLLGWLHSASPAQPLVRLLTWHPVLWVGRISYSLYLWHWPVYVLLRWTLGLDGPVLRTAALLLSFLLATLSWRFVEMPLRHWSRLSHAPRGVVIATGLVCVLSGAWLANWIAEQQHRLSISTVVRNGADWYPHGADTDALAPGCHVQTRQEALQHGHFLLYERHGCDPTSDGAPRVFAIGDSHALGYMPLFKAYVLRTGAPVFLYVNGGCPFVSLQLERESSPHCQQNMEAALTDLQTRLVAGDVLLLASLRLHRFSDQWVRFDEKQAQEAMLSAQAAQVRLPAQEAAVAVLAPLASRGVRVVFEGPKPLFRAPTYRCAETYNQGSALCQPGLSVERSLLEQYRAPVLDAFKNMVQRLPNAAVWDPFYVLCPVQQQWCEPFSEGRPLFFDGDHLSNLGNARLLPSFMRAMTNGAASPGVQPGVKSAASDSWP